LVATTALADGTPLDVPVGETIERGVGYAIGARCDDNAIVTVDMRTKDGTNVASFTGLKEGTTLCRVGTDVTRASYLFEVRVVPPKPKR
ncbi:MAG TPA: hypothetical protein VGO00_16865, partial [Kofleriaceae bacterium]|nr:hypothetical protein [Kofleriaceae bacterium]